MSHWYFAVEMVPLWGENHQLLAAAALRWDVLATLQIKRLGSTRYQLAIFCDLCRSPQWSQKAKRRPNLIPWQLGSEALNKLSGDHYEPALWCPHVESPCAKIWLSERFKKNARMPMMGFWGSEWYWWYRWYSSANNRCRNKLYTSYTKSRGL